METNSIEWDIAILLQNDTYEECSLKVYENIVFNYYNAKTFTVQLLINYITASMFDTYDNSYVFKHLYADYDTKGKYYNITYHKIID